MSVSPANRTADASNVTEIRRADNNPVTFHPGIRRNRDRSRPKSVDKFYAFRPYMWKNPKKPLFQGIFPPKPVDNCVDNVDFCIAIHCIFSLSYSFFTSILKQVDKARRGGIMKVKDIQYTDGSV